MTAVSMGGTLKGRIIEVDPLDDLDDAKRRLRAILEAQRGGRIDASTAEAQLWLLVRSVKALRRRKLALLR
jgi:hypothetical protein